MIAAFQYALSNSAHHKLMTPLLIPDLLLVNSSWSMAQTNCAKAQKWNWQHVTATREAKMAARGKKQAAGISAKALPHLQPAAMPHRKAAHQVAHEMSHEMSHEAVSYQAKSITT
jgi:hypothetical protein